MSAEAIITISAAVVALTQLAKWAKLPDRLGPLAVILLAGVGVMVWLFSQETWPPVRTDTWNIFAGWVAVATSAAGVFGFTRATASAITATKSPPHDGAGSSPTAPTVDEVADEIEERLRTEPARRRPRPPLDEAI